MSRLGHAFSVEAVDNYIGPWRIFFFPDMLTRLLTVVVIHDHIALPNLTGMNPLLGPTFTPNHARFVPLSGTYSRRLRKEVFKAAHDLGFHRDALAEGVYAWVSGPTYETPAEGRFLRAAGGDVVGMSTIPEVVAAADEAIEVTVLSLVTNLVVIPDGYESVRAEFEAEVRAVHASSWRSLLKDGYSSLVGPLSGRRRPRYPMRRC